MLDAPATTASVRRGVHPLTEDRSLFDGPRATYGRFRVLHQIGAGSVGPVFRGEDGETRQRVVIKVIRVGLTPERVTIVASALAALRDRLPAHPALTPLIDTGVVDVEPYIVTPWVDGDSLDVALREYGPAHMTDALPRLRRLADAMDAAAAAGIAHGSLHLRDIVVSVDQTILTGMGVAAVLERVGVRPPVRRPYCAPEVALGHGISPAADQYALAAIAHEWLSGRRLSGSGAAGFQVPAATVEGAAALRAVFERALAETPDDRYATATAFIDALTDRAGDAAPRGARPSRRAVAAAEAPRLAFDESGDDDIVPADEDDARPALTFAPADEADDLSSMPPRAADVVLASTDEDDDVVPADDDLAGHATLAPHVDAAPSAMAWDDEVDHAPASAPVIRLDDEDEHDAPAPPRAPAPDLFAAADAAPDDDQHEPAATAPDGGTSTTPMALWAGLLLLVTVSALAGGWALLRWGTPAPRVAVTATAPVAPTSGPVSPAPAAAPRPSAPVATSGGGADTAAPAPTAPPVPEPVTETATPAPAAPPVAAAPVTTPPPPPAAAAPATRPSSAPAPPARAAAPAAPPAARAATAPPPRQTAPAPRRTAPSPAAPVKRTAPVAPAAAGRLLVRTTPAGAEVFVNGERRGVTPLTLRALAFGAYAVRLVLPGYAPSEHRVVLAAGRSARSLEVALLRGAVAAPATTATASPRAAAAPAADPTSPGSLLVETRPAGARVLIDGRDSGVTPLTLPVLAPGAHTVRIERAGYVPISTTVRIESGSRARVAVTLTAERPR